MAKTLGLENGAVVHRTAEGLAIDLVAAGELRYSRLAAMPTSAVGIDAEVSRTFAAAILPCSPTIAAGALALADAEASTDSWAIEALSGAHLDINIRTPEEIAAVEQRREAGKLRVGIVLFGIAASFLAWQALRFNAASSIVAAETTKQNKAKSDLQKHADAVAAKTKKSTTMQDTLKLAFHPAQSISDVLTLAMNTAPKDIWLTAISLDRGKALTVRGISKGANSPSNYEAQMQGLADGDLKRFRDVKMAFQTNAEVDKTPVVQFSLSGFPVGNLPLADLTGKVVKQ